MNDLLTPQNILFALAILGTIFGVYKGFSDPDIKSTKDLALQEQSIQAMQNDIKKILENHLPRIDAKIDFTNATIVEVKLQVAKLVTVVDERIPRKE